MLKNILFIVLLFIPREVENIQQYDSFNESDSTKLSLLLQQTIREESSNPTEAVKKYETLIKEASNLPELILQAYRHKIDMLIKLGQFDKALEEARTTIKLAEKEKNNNVLGEIYISAGFIYCSLSEYDSSSYYTEKAMEIYNELDDSLGIARVKINRANILNDKGDYSGSLKLNIEAASVFEKNKDTSGLALVYNNIGMGNLKHEYYSQALEYLLKAVSISERLKDTLQLGMDYVNLGIAYRQQDSLYLAEESYRKALNIAEKLKSVEDIARISMNLGLVLTNKKEYDKAIKYYHISMEMCEKLSHKYGIMVNLINIGDLYLQINNLSKAEAYSQKALRYVEELKLPREETILTENLYTIYKKLGYFEKALYYFEKSKVLSDSLSNETNREQFLEIQTKYETEKKERQIAVLQKESLEKDFLIISISALFLLLIAFFIYRNIKIKKIARQKAELLKVKLESQNKELACKAILISQQNEKIRNLGKDIRNKLKTNSYEIPPILERVITSMEKNPKSEKEWEEFDFHFNQVNSVFVNKLKEITGDLSGIELKICYLLRLNLSSKEIGKYLGLSAGTIDNTRSQIRRKFNLAKEVNLGSFISSL
ncbi:MAG: tetratricopeptide repeat protein [Ignavibacteria bacterium]|jgi:tetratricopeptide (TPR) repeat protein